MTQELLHDIRATASCLPIEFNIKTPWCFEPDPSILFWQTFRLQDIVLSFYYLLFFFYVLYHFSVFIFISTTPRQSVKLLVYQVFFGLSRLSLLSTPPTSPTSYSSSSFDSSSFRSYISSPFCKISYLSTFNTMDTWSYLIRRGAPKSFHIFFDSFCRIQIQSVIVSSTKINKEPFLSTLQWTATFEFSFSMQYRLYSSPFLFQWYFSLYFHFNKLYRWFMWDSSKLSWEH